MTSGTGDGDITTMANPNPTQPLGRRAVHLPLQADCPPLPPKHPRRMLRIRFPNLPRLRDNVQPTKKWHCDAQGAHGVLPKYFKLKGRSEEVYLDSGQYFHRGSFPKTTREDTTQHWDTTNKLTSGSAMPLCGIVLPLSKRQKESTNLLFTPFSHSRSNEMLI